MWDPLVRILHWTLALSIALAWFTRTGFGRWHEWVGYASLVVIGVRLAWGAPVRLTRALSSSFAGRLRALQILLLALRGRAPRYLGHNPLGGWMVLALITTTIAVGVTGWLYTTDAYWGEAWLETLHDACAKLLLALVALHVAGVIATSALHRENLVRAMIHGRKSCPPADDIA